MLCQSLCLGHVNMTPLVNNKLAFTHRSWNLHWMWSAIKLVQWHKTAGVGFLIIGSETVEESISYSLLDRNVSSLTTVASFTKEVNPRLAKRLKTNGCLANLELTWSAFKWNIIHIYINTNIIRQITASRCAQELNRPCKVNWLR